MLTRATPPTRNQQFLNAHSSSSKIVFPPEIARMGSGMSVSRDNSSPHERCNPACCPNYPDNLDRRDLTTGLRYREPFHPKNTTLLGMAAHDLRHPAAALVTYSELLAEAVSPETTREQVALIDSIHSASEFMLRLLDDALELAQAESGSAQLRARPVTVSEIVAHSVAISRPLAARKRMRLSFFQQGEPLLVLLDELKMSKVFNNLIENAIQYCQPGARIKVRLTRGKDTVLVTVRDNGPGIDATDLRALFTPFWKNRSRHYSHQPSTGLGLAIAKHAVDLHGGRIWAKSEVGKGTTFYVSLPAATNPVKIS